jgi:hypothetical protein
MGGFQSAGSARACGECTRLPCRKGSRICAFVSYARTFPGHAIVAEENAVKSIVDRSAGSHSLLWGITGPGEQTDWQVAVQAVAHRRCRAAEGDWED